ncbi:SAM-dependent methyltransferase [Allokutzneria albata]|uniref:Methyltransferase domain-containing protein n=1 Tax=Allokutzneria albata TaxID=211114 RepID=A0A1G9TZC7_ALLAB|nr:class I SAM-dependent methyltransferase [Allokutzneria albata]SDM53032.1 hypothetical protein SAMN04489726_2083 [Allokutzneria albata]
MTSVHAQSDTGIAEPPEWRGSALTPLTADTAFNGFVGTHVVFALDRLGLFAELEAGAVLDGAAFCARHGLDDAVFTALISSAEAFGLLRVHGGAVELTEEGERCRHLVGFFTWAVGGYHDVFAGAAAIASGRRKFGVDVLRDEAMVALGSTQADTALMRHLLDEEMAHVDFSVLADLGSGTSDRLCRLVTAHGGRGIGLDISASATELAVENVASYGLGERVRPIRADVREVLAGAQRVDGADEVDVVMSFMFFHDLLADPVHGDNVVPLLRAAFPNAHTFLIGDTVLRPRDGAHTTLPVFSSGFELAHALMGVPLHTREDYEELFARGGLTVRRTVPFGAPHTYLFVLEAQ